MQNTTFLTSTIRQNTETRFTHNRQIDPRSIEITVCEGHSRAAILKHACTNYYVLQKTNYTFDREKKEKGKGKNNEK